MGGGDPFLYKSEEGIDKAGAHVRASIRSKRGPATADNKVVSHGDQLKRRLGPETKLVGRKESFYHFAQLTDQLASW